MHVALIWILSDKKELEVAPANDLLLYIQTMGVILVSVWVHTNYRMDQKVPVDFLQPQKLVFLEV